MKDPNFHYYQKVDRNGVVYYSGDYTHHSIRFDWTLHPENEQAPRSEHPGKSMRKGTGGQRKNYRGQIKVISPCGGKMAFLAKHPHGKKKESRVKSREFYPRNCSRAEVEKCVKQKALVIHSDNALMFSRLLKENVTPETILAELAGSLYGNEFINYRFKDRNTQETMSKKLSKLRGILAALPAKAMAKITSAELTNCTAGFPKVDLTLLSDFWDYCLMLHYCSGNNPVYVPAASSASPTSKQAKLHKLTRVPAENLKMFDKRNLDVHDGPHCGAALMGSSISSKAACALRWRDISWPTDDPSYALVKLDRPDVLCAVHNFTRPLVPAAALTLYKRRQHLAEQYSPEILRDMYVVTTKSDPTKPMLPSALVQETKRFLLETGIDRNKLLQSKESRSDPISARILTETYKDLITHTCGVPEGSGTYKFLLAQAIFNDVTSSNYVSFTSEAGSLRLYKYLRPTAPLKLYDRTLMRRCENGTDIIEVNPSDSTRCAGMISDTILYPGQEIILEAETGLTGTVEAEPLEDPTAPAESSK